MNDFTTYCESYETASSTVVTQCYNPVDVQIFFWLDFLFFATVLTIAAMAVKKWFNL